jgi:hypothetical protein
MPSEATRAKELAGLIERVEPQLKRLRDACRTVADQYDEFGTVDGEALSDLYDAEDKFWRASEPQDAE